MKLMQQLALVTGGLSGLGQACVAQLRQQGARVVIWDKHRSADDPDSRACDVRHADQVERALEEMIGQVGIPRICIQCAGIAPAKRMVDKQGVMPLTDFQHVIDVNLIGTFNVMRVVTAAMTELMPLENSGERGVVINTASIAAYEGQMGQVAYSASKGGVVAMTLPAARELARYGIRVNAIAPGLFATPLLLNMPQSVQDSLAETVPFPPRLGQPQEFAALAQHIIENSMLNGEVIRLDGALRMQAR